MEQSWLYHFNYACGTYSGTLTTTTQKADLPSEAEWEFACRAGSGDPLNAAGDIDDIAWHSGNAEGTFHPVGLKKPNAWGLYDMLGGVWEICRDGYAANLGTAAVENEDFLREAVTAYGEKIAVGADVRDGFVAVRGWTEKSALGLMPFCRRMADLGVRTLICTDISRDGAMRGTNREMYKELSENLSLQITASGGVSTLDDVRSLRAMNLYGCIIGKAYYTGDIQLKEAIGAAK